MKAKLLFHSNTVPAVFPVASTHVLLFAVQPWNLVQSKWLGFPSFHPHVSVSNVHGEPHTPESSSERSLQSSLKSHFLLLAMHFLLPLHWKPPLEHGLGVGVGITTVNK